MQLLNYNFFINAIIAAILSSLCCGIIGTYIVSRRIVFISGGITHASFGGIGIAYYLGMNPVVGAGIFGVLTAWAIEYLSAGTNIRKDSAIAILWSFGMAIGIIFIYITPGYTPDLMSYLFGSILTVTSTDILMMLVLATIIIIFFILFYPMILYLSFDEDFARTHKAPVHILKYFLITLVALTVVINIRVVGIILVLSLVTIPQATAGLFSKNFKHIIFLSILFAFIGSISGLFVSYYLNIPSGATIIFCLVLIYGFLRLIKSLFRF
ncbi:metal ABC transporter permease [Bacteroidota bacterium]